jgi:hypothetical protein
VCELVAPYDVSRGKGVRLTGAKRFVHLDALAAVAHAGSLQVHPLYVGAPTSDQLQRVAEHLLFSCDHVDAIPVLPSSVGARFVADIDALPFEHLAITCDAAGSSGGDSRSRLASIVT